MTDYTPQSITEKNCSDEMWDKFIQRVEVTTNGCWIWTGAKTGGGYGIMSHHSENISTHRFAYEAVIGPIPEKLHIDHLCRNRICCNPIHLEPVTQRENLLRGETLIARNMLVTHCPKGHPYDEANTYLMKLPNRPHHGRYCRACHNERERIRYQQNREKHCEIKRQARIKKRQSRPDSHTIIPDPSPTDDIGS